MSVKEVYQTLRYRDNNDEVLKSGPFMCTRSDAWLGHGYYFWEDSIKPAKYWGERFHDNNYIIGRGICEINEENCLFLTGSVKHNEYFEAALRQICSMGELSQETTVPRVIGFLKASGQFPFFACRADTSDAFDPNRYLTEEDFTMSVIFKEGNVCRIRLNMVIQICIYDLDKLNFDWLEICHENRKKL